MRQQQNTTNKTKQKLRVYLVITIVIIPLESKILLEVKKSKVGVYNLQWLRRYAVKKK
jgi:hypothetical protein